jgi:hypothetical protein
MYSLKKLKLLIGNKFQKFFHNLQLAISRISYL